MSKSSAEVAQKVQDMKWESEEDARTLNRAIEIFQKKDRLDRAMAIINKQEKVASKVKMIGQMLQKGKD